MKKIISLFLALIMLFSLVACSGQVNSGGNTNSDSPNISNTGNSSEENSSDPYEVLPYFRGELKVFTAESTGTKQPAPDGSITIYSNSITNCDPANTMAEFTWCENVYESLFWKDSATGEYEPLLATEWYFDSDGNFHATLREGVKFHDGTTLDAEDVLYTIKRTTETPKSKASTAMQSVDMDKSYAEDDLHVVIVFKEDMPSFMNYMSSSYMGIVSKEFCEKVGKDFDFMTADAGSGAYKLVETVTGASQTFEAFDEWWGGEVDVKKVTAVNYKDLAAMFMDFENGDLDVAFLNTYDSISRVLSGEVTDCVYYNIPNNRGIELCMATLGDDTPFADARVREALSLCIDYDALVDGVYSSTEIATVPTSMLIAGNDVGERVYDPERAAELLKEVGYSVDNPLYVKLETSNNAYSVAAAEMVQAFGSDVGFDIDVISETSQASAELQSATTVPADFSLVLANFQYWPDPQDYWFGCDAYQAEKGTYSGLKGVDDQKVSELLAEINSTMDETERNEAIKELEQYYFDQNYNIPLAFTTSATTVQSYLENIQFRSGYTFYWAAAKFAD